MTLGHAVAVDDDGDEGVDEGEEEREDDPCDA